jgi:protein-S-isoprenylcysteine O-methyltransferase Ste14
VPFAAARNLVVRGPYRFVRNPMAVSACMQLLGIAVALGSPLVLVLTLLSGIGWHTVIRPAEERDLSRRFGAQYDSYRREVRTWTPRLRPYEQGKRGPDTR